MCRSFPRQLSCLWEGGCSDYIQCDERGGRTDRWRRRNFIRQCYFKGRPGPLGPPHPPKPLQSFVKMTVNLAAILGWIAVVKRQYLTHEPCARLRDGDRLNPWSKRASPRSALVPSLVRFPPIRRSLVRYLSKVDAILGLGVSFIGE